MGARISHMNIYLISHIMQLTVKNCHDILLHIEDPSMTFNEIINGKKKNEKKEFELIEADIAVIEESKEIEIEKVNVPRNHLNENKFTVSMPHYHRVLKEFNVHPSDKDILTSLFRLIDQRGLKVTYMYINMYIHIYIYVCMYIYMYIYIYICIYVFASMCVYICMYIYESVHLYESRCIYTYKYIY
jgi:hypothetical protein